LQWASNRTTIPVEDDGWVCRTGGMITGEVEQTNKQTEVVKEIPI
jgi:hypothetical protein